ncbi:MAG: glycosyltransferase [Aureispira sp.]|nr:glycosyltransferase [Aureispira sp.]
MITLLAIIFWICVFCLFHSYVLYPIIVKIAAAGKSNNQTVYTTDPSVLPTVSFIMSLYNEDTVIEDKLKTLLATNYPIDKLCIYIGSDCSDDGTNAIVNSYAEQHPHIQFYPFQQRRGKPSVINDLIATAQKEQEGASDHILIISDANVMLEPQTIYELAKHFKNQEIVLVDSNIQNQRLSGLGEGIAASERSYISREVGIKHSEGIAWGRMMGPLGGCYAVRASHFAKVPANNLVDDFYIAMKAFEKGGLAINELQAICYEEVPNDMSIEFRRKTRISAGNFTNLAIFKGLLLPPTSSLGFVFLSHKVLRWFGPFFILLAYISSAIIGWWGQNIFYQILFLLINLGLFGVPILDSLCKRLNINIRLLRYITYFNAMNLALFSGFFKYLKGNQNGIWQRTQRNS